MADEGYVRVASDKCGDGRCCATGQKMLGMKPVTAFQRRELERQQEISKEDKKRKKQILEKALKTVQQISDIGSKVSEYLPIPGAKEAVKAISDGIGTITKFVNPPPNNSSSKVSGYNDSYINVNSITKEINDLKKDDTISKYTPEYLRRYSILKDVFDRLIQKEPITDGDMELLRNLQIFLDEVKKDKSYNILKDANNKFGQKTTKDIVSEIQNQNRQQYLTNYAKDYYKYKNIGNSMNFEN